MKTSRNNLSRYTHEGAVASLISPEQQLRRSVMACMLFEGTFYENGVDIAERIRTLTAELSFEEVASLALEAREKMKLRHVPLWLAASLARPNMNYGRKLGDLIASVIQRPDEITEFLAQFAKMYNRKGVKELNKLPSQVKIGLARAFGKFNEYALAKHGEDDTKIKLRDALFLCHAKPKDEQQATLFKKIVEGTLAVPDTWETSLSAGADKKETFTRLMKEKKLGALAFLRNLRNMKAAGVEETLVLEYGLGLDLSKVLPFRFISAARAVPEWQSIIEKVMFLALKDQSKLPGKTVLVVDNSGSMYGPKVSAKSDISRIDAACALAILLREICEECVVIGFGTTAKVLDDAKGFALAAAIQKGPGGGTDTAKAVSLASKEGYDRVIVVTDEQSATAVSKPKGLGYFINVATSQNGIGYGDWLHIDGWSDSVIDYLREMEKAEAKVAA